ncbi:hypothetical protein GMMP15_140044 [Candidatus Magnetomoraceae bacterium gMMP-15]
MLYSARPAKRSYNEKKIIYFEFFGIVFCGNPDTAIYEPGSKAAFSLF